MRPGSLGNRSDSLAVARDDPLGVASIGVREMSERTGRVIRLRHSTDDPETALALLFAESEIPEASEHGDCRASTSAIDIGSRVCVPQSCELWIVGAQPLDPLAEVLSSVGQNGIVARR
jgi:hypothetical protein